MRNTSFSPLCAAFLLLMLLSPLAAGAAQPQKPVSSPLTITVQEAEPGQMLLLGSSPEDSDLRVGALICRPLAEQAVDRKKTGGGLRLDVPLEWLDGYVAARSGKEDLPFQLWQQGEQWTSSLPIRLHDACAAAPMSRLTERWQAVREKPCPFCLLPRCWPHPVRRGPIREGCGIIWTAIPGMLETGAAVTAILPSMKR